ncbi:MAG: FecR domain-containing protein [Candidatus Omnitrophica bacterium]|nr:FecR domain-containing protein [Candidatus Omnitrophota bacterium]
MRVIKIILIFGLIISESILGYSEERVGIIEEIKGKVEVKSSGGRWEEAKLGMVLREEDTIRTKGNSYALLSLRGEEEAIVEIKENSELMLSELGIDEEGVTRTLLDLAIGEVLIKVDKLRERGSNFEVKTPTSIVGVRGTIFSVKVETIE